MANTHIPQLSQEETAALPIKWVIKAWKNHNLNNFEYRLHQLLADGSIGINFGHYQELPPNVTDEHIMEAQRHIGHPGNKKSKYVEAFRNDIKIGDVIIAQGGPNLDMWHKYKDTIHQPIRTGACIAGGFTTFDVCLKDLLAGDKSKLTNPL